jgi:hypothetical protein
MTTSHSEMASALALQKIVGDTRLRSQHRQLLVEQLWSRAIEAHRSRRQNLSAEKPQNQAESIEVLRRWSEAVRRGSKVNGGYFDQT